MSVINLKAIFKLKMSDNCLNQEKNLNFETNFDFIL